MTRMIDVDPVLKEMTLVPNNRLELNPDTVFTCGTRKHLRLTDY